MRKLIILPLLLLPGLALADQPCEFTAPQNLDLKLAGVHTLELDMGANDLHLAGAKGASDVQARGRACASSQKLLDSMHVTQHREGDRLIIKVEGDANWSSSLFGGHYAYVNLRVHMPDNLPVVLHTGSGDATLQGIASLTVESGSGDVNLKDIKGAVTASTGSGDLEGSDVGAFNLKSSGSGDVRVHGVHGDAVVGDVGSGDITLGDVAGSVNVDEVGSGDIEVQHVGGSVTVGSIGSGDVDAVDVGGDFTVRSHGSGDIHPREVKGKVNVPED